MNSDRLLGYTLVASFLVHGMIVFQSPRFNPFTPAPKVQEIAVRYIKEAPQNKPLPKNLTDSGRQKLIPMNEPFLRLDSQIVTGTRSAPLPYVEQPQEQGAKSSASRRPGNNSLPAYSLSHKSGGFSKPIFSSSAMTAIKKKINLPAIEIAKIDNPSYISYYQVVREKIRRSAYENYTHNETGEVYISFIIFNDGYLKEARLVEERTTAKEYLKSIALRSIKDSSPFPNFPKELDYPQLSFNIIISFEIE